MDSISIDLRQLLLPVGHVVVALVTDGVSHGAIMNLQLGRVLIRTIPLSISAVRVYSVHRRHRFVKD